MGVCKSQSHAHPRAAPPHIFLDEECKTLKKTKKISSSIHIYNKIFFHFCICVVLYCLSFEIAAIKKSTHLGSPPESEGVTLSKAVIRSTTNVYDTFYLCVIYISCVNLDTLHGQAQVYLSVSFLIFYMINFLRRKMIMSPSLKGMQKN